MEEADYACSEHLLNCIPFLVVFIKGYWMSQA